MTRPRIHRAVLIMNDEYVLWYLLVAYNVMDVADHTA